MARTLSPKQKQTAQDLVGKTIARVVLYPFNPNREGSTMIGGLATNPHVFFTDGTFLRFVAEETEVGEAGVALVLCSKPKK